MKILYFVQYFNLPHEPGGSRPYQFAREWARSGHEVTVITGAVNHKTLTVPPEHAGRLVVSEQVEGVRVLRVWSYAGIRGSFKKRLLNFLTYAMSASVVGLLRGGKADVVYASSTPLTVGLPGFVNSLLRRASFVFELRDLWPESAIVAGVLREKALLTRAANALARLFYRTADRLVAVTQGIKAGLVDAGVPEDKVVFIPNGVDDWMVERGETGIPRDDARFRVAYVGAHGKWNGLEQILDAAAAIQAQPSAGREIEFVFIGDGDEKQRLQERARESGLAHIQFLDAMPKQDAFDELRRADASVVVTWDHPFQRMVLANKIFDYLAAGRPVLVGAHGEMADLVEAAGCGLVTPPGKPERLADSIVTLADMTPEQREAMGRRGRRFILENYQRRALAWRLLTVFGALTGQAADPKSDRPSPKLVEGNEA